MQVTGRSASEVCKTCRGRRRQKKDRLGLGGVKPRLPKVGRHTIWGMTGSISKTVISERDPITIGNRILGGEFSDGGRGQQNVLSCVLF